MQFEQRYRDQGLVLIGVHSSRGAEKMPAFVKEREMPFAVASDVNDQTITAYDCDSYPDYYVIDKRGILRFADLANAELERAVKALLAEPYRPVLPDQAEVAAQRAQRRGKRLAVHWQREAGDPRTIPAEGWGALLRQEFEVVELPRSQHGSIARAWQVPAGPDDAITLLDEDLQLLASIPGKVIGTVGFQQLVQRHRAPQVDAEQRLAAGLRNAREGERHVLLLAGSSRHPESGLLEELLARPTVAQGLEQTHVVVWVDLERHPGIARLPSSESRNAGPWLAWIDGQGQLLGDDRAASGEQLAWFSEAWRQRFLRSVAAHPSQVVPDVLERVLVQAASAR